MPKVVSFKANACSIITVRENNFVLGSYTSRAKRFSQTMKLNTPQGHLAASTQWHLRSKWQHNVASLTVYPPEGPKEPENLHP